MCSSLVRKAIALLLAQAFFLPIAFGQQQTPPETRPRRTQPVWTPPSATTPIISAPTLTTTTGPEPRIRVALSTDARSAVISTSGHLMNASGGGTTLAAFECLPVAPQRVRKRKRTRKRSRRLRVKTHTPLTTLKLKRGECLSAASFRVKRPKSCARVSRQQALTRQSRDNKRKPLRKNSRLRIRARCV